MAKLIFTADDYGVIPCIDAGIIKAVNAGKINSVAAFSNHPNSIDNVKRLQDQCRDKKFDIGCHLTITSGKPVIKQRNFVRGNLAFFINRKKKGYFRAFTQIRRAPFFKKHELRALELELSAQVEKFLDAKIPITNVSCHHNVLTLFEDYTDIMLKVAKKYNLAVRSPIAVPKSKNNLFILMMYLRLVDNLLPHDRDKMMVFSKRISSYLRNRPDNPPMPLHLNSIHYGPPPLPTHKLDKKEIEDEAEKKHTLLLKEIDLPDNRVTEFVFHLIDNDVANLEQYCNQTDFKTSQYTGIESGYFDSRMAEMEALLKFPVPINDLISWRDIPN